MADAYSTGLARPQTLSRPQKARDALLDVALDAFGCAAPDQDGAPMLRIAVMACTVEVRHV